MNKYRELAKNTSIFAIANLGSKLLSILLLPFYTYVLSQTEYGTIDLVTTTISLALPIITLNIYEGTLRFSIKSEYRHEEIFNTSVIIVVIGNAILLMMYPLLSKINVLNSYLILLYILIFMQSINAVFSQFARGIGAIKVFALNGVVNTFIMLILNIVLLGKFGMGINGYLISMIISNFISNLMIICTLNLKRYIEFKKIDKKLLKKMLSYVIPLIPNSLVWWVINLSDRYVILYFLGASANGLYAVANKIPTVLNLLNSIFNQAWQISAIEEEKSSNRNIFYKNIFSVLATIMVLATSIILLFIRPILSNVLFGEFKSVWRITPLLVIASMFLSFSSFFGTNYLVSKKTAGLLKSTIIGAVINIILNFNLIPLFGINGATFATMISFFIVWIIRVYDSKRNMSINVELKIIVSNLAILFLQVFVLYIENYTYIFYEIILLFCIFFINRKNIKMYVKGLNNIYKKIQI